MIISTISYEKQSKVKKKNKENKHQRNGTISLKTQQERTVEKSLLYGSDDGM